MSRDQGSINDQQPYDLMLDKLDEIEQALDHADTTAIIRLAQDVEQCLERIKEDDRNSGPPTTAEHRLVVETILTRNHVITARIREITALQRSELSQLKIGRETAKGYAPHQGRQSGAIINSTN